MTGLLILAAALGLAADRGLPAVLDHRDWIGVCDNTAECTAMGLPAADPGGAYVSLSRSGEPLAAAVLRVGVYPGGGSGTVIHLRARGFEADLPAHFEDEELVAETKDPALVTGFVREVEEDGRALTISAGRVETTLGLAGAEGVLAWMDDRQDRSGGAGALVRRGPRPASATPSPPPEPVISPAPEGTASEIRPALFPKNLLERPELRGCASEALANADARAEWRLGPNLILWEAPCATAGFNQKSVFLISDDRGRDIRPAPIPPLPALAASPAPAEPAATLVNADFDPKTMTLSAFDKGAAPGDCGVLARFIWTGRVFAPAEVDYMPECRGLAPEAWPTLLRARVR